MSNVNHTQGWDFSRLPAHEHQRAVQAVEALDVGALLDLHDMYTLSPYTYCCDRQALLVWFRYGIASGQIHNPTPQSDERRDT